MEGDYYGEKRKEDNNIIFIKCINFNGFGKYIFYIK